MLDQSSKNVVAPPHEVIGRSDYDSRTAEFSVRAETILEVVIAVAVIMVILAPASALYIASRRSTVVNRNDLVAAALTEEGLEIVRNIRDTNFIKFSDQARDCWNTKPQPDPAQGGCEAAGNKIAEGSYRLSINADQASADYLKWTLDPAAEELHKNAEGKYDLVGQHDEEYRLTLDEDAAPILCASIGPPRDPPGCHAHFADDTHLYYHSAAGAAAANASPFYREIIIENIELIDPPPAGTGPDWTNGFDAVKIISRVLYRTGVAVRAIERVVFLTREPS